MDGELSYLTPEAKARVETDAARSVAVRLADENAPNARRSHPSPRGQRTNTTRLTA
ncbi:MAG: hypothetical protein H0U05_03345 [Actinobacteria bacterium]|nr:hypothetical protein [Actinomycetota bacterium]